MLTENQIDTIMMLSGAVWLGLVGGALTGALAGALICAIRTRRLLSFLPGSFCAILPAAAFAIAVSLLAALIQMLLCNPGHKSGWDVPVWGTSVQAIAIFSAGASGAFFAQRRSGPLLRSERVGLWASIGAFLGALAFLGTSFDGYYVLQSNARPAGHAVIGFAAGGLGVWLWCLVAERLQGTRDDSTTSA